MRIRYLDLSLEELEDLDRENTSTRDEDESTTYRHKIDLYTAMHIQVQKLVKQKKEDPSYLESIKERLVYNLVHYGTYLKMADEKNDRMAEPSLRKALSFDPTNPIAAYRLGFLSYKELDFLEALHYFQQSIANDGLNKNPAMSLNEKQLMRAHLYLTNSALNVAHQAQAGLKQLPTAEIEQVPGYEFSELFSSINSNDNYLLNHAFCQQTIEGRLTCSKQDCENLAINNPRDTLVLYFGDVETSLNYNGRAVSLSKRTSDLLRYLLAESSEGNPAKAEHVKKFFENLSIDEELKWETYRRAISRLRETMQNCSIPVVIATVPNGQAYYFDGSIPYMTLYRVDEETE